MKSTTVFVSVVALAAAAGCAETNRPAPADPSATQTTSSSSSESMTPPVSTTSAPNAAYVPPSAPAITSTPAPTAPSEPAASTGGASATASSPTDVGPSRPDADNTRVNARDRHGATLTPMDQGGSEGDRKMTQKIRQAVMGDHSLSFTAKNVKIITVGGKVTLRGAVKSDQERSNIETRATQIAGEGQVDNQIEVKK